MVGFLAEIPGHRLDYIARIAEQFHPARLLEIRKAKSRRCDLGLLVRSVPEIFTDRAPEPFKSQDGDSRGPSLATPISQAGSVADDGDLFHFISRRRRRQHKAPSLSRGYRQ